MINKCIFPVAGYGTRFLPFTKAVPKEMLPILNKPLIQYAVEEAMDAGIFSMCMIVNKFKDSIRLHFSSDTEMEMLIRESSKYSLLEELYNINERCSFNYIKQQEMLGLGDAINQGKKFINKDSFAVILPDDFFPKIDDSVLKQMIELHSNFEDYCIIAVEEINNDNLSNYGVIDGKLLPESNSIFRVSNLIEKPELERAPSNLAVIGRYIFTPKIFDILKNTKADRRGEIQITDAINVLANEGKVLALKINLKRYDCGSIDGFIKANIDMHSKYIQY